ncbi:EAL domain-containing protein [Aquibacillus albus]|uniref:PAS domain S-box-containing protein n=1 Tax=Aquibacillus albus TaxID=1168171 RepID=A0ABS2N343_9BACI|nr:EAL domain-containing protein [Aquibacillus albus]MBM7572560.1 PAS domain S-box-containing protein [Aquibacillus albus]
MNNFHRDVQKKDIQRALEEQEFCMVYQPQIDLSTGHILGIEALLRWNHPECGWISPAEFIPIAENSGLMTQVTKWVLRKACEQNKTWQNKGLPEVKVSVNISPVDFENQELYELILNTLQETGLSPNGLELEITETAMLKYVDKTVDILKKLKEIGVQIAIDDFGKGNTSISYLKDFPINTVKIDQSFIKNIPYNQKESSIVKNIIQMCHNLDLQTVAEGVETEEQVIFLSLHNCTVAQGFLFSRPLHVEDYVNRVLTCEYDAISTIQRLDDQITMRSAKLHDHRFQSLFNHNPDIVCSFGLNGKFLSVNKAFEKILGYRVNEVLDKDMFSMVHPDDIEKAQVQLEQVLNREEPENIDIRIEHKNYSYVHCNISCFPMYLGKRVVGIYSVAKDMTEKKKLEKALYESEKKYRLITENMSDLVSVIDIDGRIQYASPSHYTMLGFDSDQMIGKNIFDFTLPENLERIKKQHDELIQTKSPKSFETRIKDAEGNIIWVETQGTPVLTEDETLSHIVLVARDITKRKQEELNLYKIKKDLKSMLSQQQGMTFKFKKKGNDFIHTLCEGELLYEFGLKSEDVVNQSLFDFLPQSIAIKKHELYSFAWSGKDVTYEGELNHIYYIAKLKPVIENGEVVEVIGSCVDYNKEDKNTKKIKLVNKG